MQKGSAHDSRVFALSELGTNPSKYFQGREYLLADSGYPCLPTIVPIYKCPRNRALSASKVAFNNGVSRARVRIEHVFGRIKARFQSLRGLRLDIRDGDYYHLRASLWIRVCFILYNISIKDALLPDWFQGIEQTENEENSTEINAEETIPPISSGEAHRAWVHAIWDHN